MSMIIERVTETPESVAVKKARWRPQWSREHLALSAILLLSGFLGMWNLSINNYSNEYYAAAVRSMIQSWHNFFYVSFDPGGFITVDKPPVAFWVQAAFAKVFGFSGVTLLLPEALAGIAGVFLLYLIVKKAFGTAAGLVSALILAVTPIWVVMNRDNNPDSILVFTLILAAWAMLRGAEKGRLRWVMLASVLVGIAFNVKMLEAYVVLPAFYAMYFFFARTGWRKRILHLALASVVIAVVSFSWAVAVDLTPASARPYVDSSSVNSELDLILNYNGLGRIDGNEMTGGNNGDGGTMPSLPSGTGGAANSSTTTDGLAMQPPSNTSGTATGSSSTQTSGNFPGAPGSSSSNGAPDGNGGPGGGNGFGGQAGITRLLTPSNAGEFNWFMPLVVLGMIYLGAYAWSGMAKGEDRSRRLQMVALWAGWFLVYGVVFSLSKGTFHPYYLTIMAPAEAALAGTAVVMLWKRYRQGGWMAWLLPVGLAATAFYQAYLLTGYTSWNQWLSPVLVVAGVCALVGLIAGRFLRSERFGRVLSRGVVWGTVACLLVVPTAWSIQAVFTPITGSIVSGTPNGGMGGGFGGNSSTGISQNWLSFIQTNLSGQLQIVAIVASLAVVVVGLRFLLRHPRWFNRPVLTAVLLAFFLTSSAGWWINAAQAQTTTTSTSTSAFRDGGPGGQMSGMGGESSQSMISYLEANQGDYKYLVAVSSSQSAASIIIQTGKPVMSLGGFTGSARTVTTTAELEQMIANQVVRYFMVGGGGGPGGGNSIVSQYVQQNCTAVASSAYSSTTSTSTSSSGSTTSTTSDGRSFGGQQQSSLYVCGG